MADSVENVLLNIGCGRKHLPGFINMDIVQPYDKKLDARHGLPFSDGSVDGIYSEHFFEHLTQAEGLRFLRECRRVLKKGAHIRIAMPDLDRIVERYMSDDWRAGGDMFALGFDWVMNRCEMLNIAMREWGHKHVYNEEELIRIANLAGFRVAGKCGNGQSDLPYFRDLETRPGSTLIMEFKPIEPIDINANPLVSILIPAVKPKYFSDALNSALSQTYANIEIIVSDDSQGDEIKNVVDSVADDRIKYMKNVPAKGPLGNYLYTLELASGQFIKYLHDDDILLPACVADMVKAFEHEGVTLVTSYKRLIDENGKRLHDKPHNRMLFNSPMLIKGCDFAERMLKFRLNFVGEPSCIMFRKDCVDWVSPHPLSFAGAGREKSGLGDVGIALNLLSQGDMVYLPQCLSEIRMHPEQWSNVSDARAWSLTTWRQFLWHSIRLGMFKKLSLAWTLNVKKLDGVSAWRKIYKVSPSLIYCQLRWVVSLLRGNSA